MNLNPKKKRKLEHKKKARALEAKQDAEDEEVSLLEQDKQKKQQKIDSHINFTEIPKPDYSHTKPIVKKFWEGEPGEDSPSDELKELRKSIGVLASNIITMPSTHLTWIRMVCLRH